jgi:hypothetical protein
MKAGAYVLLGLINMVLWGFLVHGLKTGRVLSGEMTVERDKNRAVFATIILLELAFVILVTGLTVYTVVTD